MHATNNKFDAWIVNRCIILLFQGKHDSKVYFFSQGKNKQALKNKVIFACHVAVKQQKLDLFHLATIEILNKVVMSNR
jgi:hypothetical protein